MSAPELHESHDLRQFFRAVGSFSGARALNSTPKERLEAEGPVEMLETERVRISAAPLEVAAFVDGIQASLCVTYREHRPVYLSYTAAGAVGHRARPLALRERLEVVCSSLDRDWVDALGSTIPVEELVSSNPQDLEREALLLLRSARAHHERTLVQDLLDQEAGVLVVDGAVLAWPYSECLVGVVKSADTRYLPDESILYGMPSGFRSPIFKIPAGLSGSGVDRYSCYLRLHSAQFQAWSFGLIRLESFTPDLLEPLAARCMNERQGGGSGDARWDRHLRSVRVCEDFLRARRPPVFAMG